MLNIKCIEGKLKNKNFKFAIIASRFNNFIVNNLIGGAVDFLSRHDVKSEDITIIKVPGSLEIPMVAKKIADSKKYDGIICLGAIIKGETHHFEVIASEVAKGLAQVGLEALVPVSFGILTTYTTEQAVERAGNKAGNKGVEAAASCLEMVDLCKRI